MALLAMLTTSVDLYNFHRGPETRYFPSGPLNCALAAIVSEDTPVIPTAEVGRRMLNLRRLVGILYSPIHGDIVDSKVDFMEKTDVPRRSRGGGTPFVIFEYNCERRVASGDCEQARGNCTFSISEVAAPSVLVQTLQTARP